MSGGHETRDHDVRHSTHELVTEVMIFFAEFPDPSSVKENCFGRLFCVRIKVPDVRREEP